jgi:exodeoxyribonuclease-5
MPTWSPQQDAALLAVDQFLRDPDQQVFRLFGYAGTGKTTLAKYFCEGVDDVVFGAYTGKAAHVLRQKGCPGAMTIHSMIYHSKEKGQARLKELEAMLATLLIELREAGQLPEGNRRVGDLRTMIETERKNLSRPTFTLNEDSVVRDVSLVVIDECSMVDGRMGEDLLSFGTKVLVLGDPAQLPPVGGGGFFTEDCRPDVMLTEIHRQAAESPIIAMATKVRQGERLQHGDYGNCKVVAKIGPEQALAADQLLVGRNKTRHSSNARMRSLLGRAHSMYPVIDDKLVCLRNNHDKGLLNGAVWHVDDVGAIQDERVYMTLVSDEERDVPGAIPLEVEAHTHHFEGKDEALPWWERKAAEEFDYGYAMTVHKSQGSQWDSVILFDEAYCFRSDRDRWLYTGITRAAEDLIVVDS